jgi:hypothetical protein
MEVGTPVVLEFADLYREYSCNLLIIWELRDFAAPGTLQLEYWSIGVMERWIYG